MKEDGTLNFWDKLDRWLYCNLRWAWFPFSAFTSKLAWLPYQPMRCKFGFHPKPYIADKVNKDGMVDIVCSLCHALLRHCSILELRGADVYRVIERQQKYEQFSAAMENLKNHKITNAEFAEQMNGLYEKKK